jgi:hypothetical protein
MSPGPLGNIDGEYILGSEGIYGKIQIASAERKLKLADASPEDRTKWDIALTIDEARAFATAFPEPRSANEHKAVIDTSGENPVYEFFIKPVTLDPLNDTPTTQTQQL